MKPKDGVVMSAVGILISKALEQRAHSAEFLLAGKRCLTCAEAIEVIIADGSDKQIEDAAAALLMPSAPNRGRA